MSKFPFRDSLYLQEVKQLSDKALGLQALPVRSFTEAQPLSGFAPYHCVDSSPWPLLMSIALLGFAATIISYFTRLSSEILAYGLAIALLIIIITQWWRDVVREAKGGYHTLIVQRGLVIGFLLFLISEIMLFASLFWAYFHSSLSPSVEIGATWPPIGIQAVDPWSIPLLGSCVLLASGFILTLGHHAIVLGHKSTALIGFLFTLILGSFFLFLQFNEYSVSQFTIADSFFGSVFYFLTGLHALHIICGLLFLAVCLTRIFLNQITTEHHLGVNLAIWYWHFVDIIWLFLFLIIYCS